MRIVGVEWRIKKGQESEFLEYWSTRSTIPDRSGLVGEFLNRVESREQYPWMVWELNEGWTTFINIGIWREGADFQQQIGRFIDNSRPPLAFEADRRRRIFLAPERWRIGNTPLLIEDHPAVSDRARGRSSQEPARSHRKRASSCAREGLWTRPSDM
jgi:hypothetical protein